MKKIISLALAVAAIACAAAGCGPQKGEEGKINLTVGGWPADGNSNLPIMEARKDLMEETHPDVKILTDTFDWDLQAYKMKAETDMLPNLYRMPFTEIKMSIEDGYVADLTEILEEFGYAEKMNPVLKELVSDDEGRIYGIPCEGYYNGLYINKKIFKEAGLVNEDGSIKYPKTWDEVAEYSKIIKDKTGIAGFALPTTNNCGGWHFMNIAWSYGVEFMQQDADGKWKATFNTPECVEALNFIKDLKWNANAMPDEFAIDQLGLYQIFATGRAAMMISNPPCQHLYQKYDMDPEDVMAVPMPAGPKGAYTQVGGAAYLMKASTTKDQQRAAIWWLDLSGATPVYTEDALNSLHETNEKTKENGGIVMPKEAFPFWTDEESTKVKEEILAQDANVDLANYEEYFDVSAVEIKPEYPRCTQELYAEFDKIIQAVLTEKDANIEELVANANEQFQMNHLDKIEY